MDITEGTTHPNLWDSYAGISSADAARLFGQAADVIDRDGYDRYEPGEDEGVNGRTIFGALTLACQQHAATDAARITGTGVTDDQLVKMIETDTENMVRDLTLRLAGLLYVTGQARFEQPMSDMHGVVWSWTRDVAHWRGGKKAVYRGGDSVVKLLRLAAATVAAVEA